VPIGKEAKMQNRFVRLGDLTPEETRFLWPDRIPLGGLTILEGDAGSGKSTVLYDIAARLTTGRPMPGATQPSTTAGVVFLQAEDNPARTILPNLKACGGDPSQILVLNRAGGSFRSLRLPDDAQEIETAIKEIGAALVVIDPLTDFANFNLNDDRAVRAGLRPLVTIAERNDVAVVLVRHLRKTEHKSALHRGAGSIAIAALARSVLVVGDDPQSDDASQHVLAMTKSNVAIAPSLAYRIRRESAGGRVVDWLGESHLTADEVLGCSQQQSHSALLEAAPVLYATLADGPVCAREVILAARAAGVCERTLRRAKSLLQVRSRRRATVGEAIWYWVLPEDERILRPWRDRQIEELCDALAEGADGVEQATRQPTGKPARPELISQLCAEALQS
jgi:DNA repair protein RadA/Sms